MESGGLATVSDPFGVCDNRDCHGLFNQNHHRAAWNERGWFLAMESAAQTGGFTVRIPGYYINRSLCIWPVYIFLEL